MTTGLGIIGLAGAWLAIGTACAAIGGRALDSGAPDGGALDGGELGAGAFGWRAFGCGAITSVGAAGAATIGGDGAAP
jgi:hypothetical protein